MSVESIFGNAVCELGARDPQKAQRLLRFGWRAMGAKFKFLPDKRLLPGDTYLATIMMNMMTKPLIDPGNSSIVSIFTPCELIHEAHLNPFNVEAYSAYLSASYTERSCIERAEAEGISETLCSYHKTFIGAAELGILPKPRCIVYTNLYCDANLLTFRHLAEFFDVPFFFLDVPVRRNDDSVTYVADQLRELKTFLEHVTGRVISEEGLVERVALGKHSLETYDAFQTARADKYISTDLVSPLYAAMTNNVMLGTQDEDNFVSKLLDDVQSAPPKKGLHIYWMHTIPYWMDSAKELLMFSDRAQIVGDELAQCCTFDYDPADPYRAMAYRMVYSVFNGPASGRIKAGIAHARQTGADGVVWFNHIGCKHTAGASQLAKRTFEAAGIPFLVVDGDGCDKSVGGEGQMSTRLGAFLEMLEQRQGASA